MKMNFFSKAFALALAAVALSLPLANNSEAAPPPKDHRPGIERHHKPHLHDHMRSDVYFFKHRPPKHHHVCRNPYHSRWAPHFHCADPRHHHV